MIKIDNRTYIDLDKVIGFEMKPGYKSGSITFPPTLIIHFSSFNIEIQNSKHILKVWKILKKHFKV